MDTTLRLAQGLGRHSIETCDPFIRLATHATLAGRLSAGTCIAVQSGRIWLTQSGDANDYFVDGGQRHILGRAGHVVIESLTPQVMLRVWRPPSRHGRGFHETQCGVSIATVYLP